MVGIQDLSKEEFLHMARLAGLDHGDAQHMDNLFRYLQDALCGLESINDLDLTSVEPSGVYQPAGE
jgi:hypothetical protein